jgi:NitT/TauT family transport system substrate-binding protein
MNFRSAKKPRMHRHFLEGKTNIVSAVPPLKGTRLLHRTSEVLASLGSVLLSLAVFLGCDIPSARVFHVCTNQWPGYEPLYLARSLGYFNDNEVRLVEYSSASDCMRAFGNGTVEAAGLTLDEALQLAEDGIAVKIILVMDFSNGADALLARPEIRTLGGLKGRRVGVENTATGAYVLHRALQKGGLRLEDVSVVPTIVAEHERAYLSGRIDAVVTFEPVRTYLKTAGMHELFSSREIPGEIIDVLIVERDCAERFPREVASLHSAWHRALEYLRANPKDATERMAPRAKLSPAEFRNTLEDIRFPAPAENHKLLAGDSPGLLIPMRQLVETMVSHKLLRRPVAVKSLL